MMEWDKYLPILAIVLDAVIGDPRSKLHPVVVVGNYITQLERLLRWPNWPPQRQIAAGGLLVLVVLISVYGTVWLLLAELSRLSSWTGWFVGGLLLAFTISPRSLATAGSEIQRYLEAGNLIEARHKVSWIVGRDTADLNVGQVTRATVETVAENIVDGIISPLFYFALGGVPLACLYRAVNTMDSMLGYKNEKYLFFGRIAARTDDLFNYIPARITGMLLVIAALLLGHDPRRSARMTLRDAGKHPSPNSGIPEAAVAGALGVRLGGLNYYGGIPSHRATMGDPVQQLRPVHIHQAAQMMYVAALLFTAMVVVIL